MNNLYNLLKKGIGLLVLSLCLIACEELVEIELPDNQLNTPAVFSDKHTINAALSNLYSNFRDAPLPMGGNSGGLSRYTDELESFFTDDYFYTNSITTSDPTISQLWGSSYSNIYHINAFIEGLQASNVLDENEKKVLLGEVHFLRGLYYHYLTQLFGDIPYITTTDYKLNSRMGKTPYLEVLDLVEKDLKTALESIDNIYRHQDRIYPNKAVVELVLAKNYLLQKRFDLAEQYAQNIMDNPLYALETDLNKVFKRSAHSTLWQRSPYDINLTESNTVEAADYIFTTLPPTRIALSNSLMHAFELNDLRLQLWTKTLTDGELTYSHAYKYGKSFGEIEYSIVFRLEEAYFIKAEALTYQEKVADAVNVLNEIRTKRGLISLPTALSKTDFITELLTEYQREFFTEGGHRFLDLKRNNRLQNLETVKPNWEAKHDLLPIPESELLLNENLKPQNYGY
ncbi:RagB/SusD family nutrient uptake outer membrane protein [Myroides guanonis]|uniref:RagB/SusD domain-containing protein n=1 Tax=Myroides guanonis TaxID=1150112 RepID=A0A1I3PPD0_9FLAO|nr:RagB/SusD family nutrient uptake outer membrane protein [Myroides guanonis]SFJ23289.1 RagB/SusD domain-containing protein [Myroides guanonis]